MTAPNTERNNTESTETETLNTEVQPSSSPLSVDTTGRELYFAAIREKNAEIERLRTQVEERNKPTPKTGEEAWGEFTQNPRDLIQQEVREAVKPLNEFIQSLQKGNAFQGLKQQARSISPQYARVLEKAEGYVDQALSNAAPTIENVVGAINLVAGAIAMGQINGLSASDLLTSPTVPTKVPTPKLVPPTLAPSSSPIVRPTDNTTKPWENLTETELAMARYYKMSPEQFWKQMQGDSIEVDPTKGGDKK